MELVANLVAGAPRDTNSAWLGQALEPSCHVDPVAIDIVVLDDNVADVDANAELDAPIIGDAGVAIRHTRLHGDGALHGIDDAAELDQHAVTCRLDDAAVALRDFGVDELLSMGFRVGQGAHLIGTHEAAEADHIGGQNCRQSSFDSVRHRGLLRHSDAFAGESRRGA